MPFVSRATTTTTATATETFVRGMVRASSGYETRRVLSLLIACARF